MNIPGARWARSTPPTSLVHLGLKEAALTMCLGHGAEDSNLGNPWFLQQERVHRRREWLIVDSPWLRQSHPEPAMMGKSNEAPGGQNLTGRVERHPISRIRNHGADSPGTAQATDLDKSLPSILSNRVDTRTALQPLHERTLLICWRGPPRQPIFLTSRFGTLNKIW
ncbi:hypothetical protein VTI74DRAFT_6124 [Chaetomium olivicolor]